MEQLGIDVMGDGTFPETERRYKYILAIIDYFTKWAVAIPIRDQTTETVAPAVINCWVTKYGVFLHIHSDGKKMFESEVFHTMCRLLRIKKTQTSPYRPQSDGNTERFNRTLKNMLVKEAHDFPENWDRYLPSLLMAISNGTRVNWIFPLLLAFLAQYALPPGPTNR